MSGSWHRVVGLMGKRNFFQRGVMWMIGLIMTCWGQKAVGRTKQVVHASMRPSPWARRSCRGFVVSANEHFLERKEKGRVSERKEAG